MSKSNIHTVTTFTAGIQAGKRELSRSVEESTSGKPGEDVVSLAKRESMSSCKTVPVNPVTSTVPVEKGGVRTVVEKGMPELRSPEKKMGKHKKIN